VKSLLTRHKRSSQTGFGLLEVLVSLVIFASVGFSVLAWLQQSVTTVQRLRDFYEVQDARKTALEIARSLNPTRQTHGELTQGTLRLVWDAQALGDAVIQTGYPAGIGRHRLQLYTTTLTVYRGPQTSPWFVESLILIGHRLESAPSDAMDNG
jgi:general secretion pathway protein I